MTSYQTSPRSAAPSLETSDASTWAERTIGEEVLPCPYGIEPPEEGRLSPPVAHSTPKKTLSIPAAPRKPAAPLWRPWVLAGIPPFPNLSTEEEEEEKELAREEATQRKEEEEALYSTWDVRPKFLRWTPAVIEEVEDSELLFFLYSRFAYPSSQPRNADEAAYCAIISEALIHRMAELRINPPSQ